MSFCVLEAPNQTDALVDQPNFHGDEMLPQLNRLARFELNEKDSEKTKPNLMSSPAILP